MPDLSLADIVSPLSEKEFLDAHWQQRTYHAAHRAPDYFSALITASDI
jgi:ribosomal protein L16 Arg81 hydroxylase